METSAFDYGIGVTVPLVVTQPVMSCAVCGQRWTDWRAERARTETVLRYRQVFAGAIQTEPRSGSNSPSPADMRAGNTSNRADADAEALVDAG
jgi:hypothetical protein